MAKKTEKQKWKKKAWAALSKYKRSTGKCQRCGKIREPKYLDAHHLVPKAKGNYALLEPDNVVVLCGFYCHRHWWHGISTWDEQKDLVDEWIGLERYFEIKKKSYKTVKYSIEDYKEMIRRWTDELGEKT